MIMDVFAEKICSAVEERLGNGVQTEIREVRKNNSVLLHGLLILSEGQTVVPTIYLESFLEAYESGIPFEAIVCKVLSVYETDAPRGSIDMGFFRSYEAVKDRICYRLIGRKGNEALLEEVPHLDFLDMAVCFYYAYHGEGLGDGSILIHNSHMEMWDICAEELFHLARSNTPRIFPWKCSSMEQILNEMMGQDGNSDAFIPNDGTEAVSQKIPMRVLSNQKRIHGAVCILYPGALEELSGKEGNLFIIPSSIHETILLPDDGINSAEDLKKMIYEVNRTQVAPEEVLTDSLYYYDSVKKEIVIV